MFNNDNNSEYKACNWRAEVKRAGAVGLPVSGVVDEHRSKTFVEKNIGPDTETYRYTRTQRYKH